MVQLQVENFLEVHYQSFQKDKMHRELIKVLHQALQFIGMTAHSSKSGFLHSSKTGRLKLYLDHFGPNTTQLAEHVHWQHQFLRSIDLFHDAIMDHHHAIDRAEEGFFSPTFLPTTQLASALKNITKALPDNLDLPVSKENLPDYYETRLSTFLPLNETMMIVMNIPLVNRSPLYTPYQVKPFPSTTTPPVMLVTEVTRVYVNRQGNRFFACNKQDALPTCLFARPRVCDVNGKFIHTAPKDCVSNIIAFDKTKGNGRFPHTLCHFAAVDDLPDAVI
jgi:hypothetical protein